MKNTLQKQYEGFLKTPFLWQNDAVFTLKQFEITSLSSKFDMQIDYNLRLGKYIERFVSFQLEQQEDISILAENIQIQQDKITIGELDCLLLKNNEPIHLEIIYKFYVYDPLVGTTEIEHFIGPNRKDSLTEKLVKLKEKQLPLLYSNACKRYLSEHNLNAEHIHQHVYFKAQLFLPFNNENVKLKNLNNNCIVGLHISHEVIDQFKDCKFYVPNKKDWLITPHANVFWLNFETFKVKATQFTEQRYSTLFWVKFKNGSIKKMFLVWW